MQRSRLPGMARQLVAAIPDADLLDRFVLQRADDAFAQLVARYSRLVWGQCRNLLPDDADADDAFQATFLTLARSAKSLQKDIPLGPWLHGVAFRVCKNARRANGRRAKHERANARPEATRPIAESTWETAFAAAAEEVQKLPEAERTAFVLCYIEGHATTAAAASLGVRPGTFATRLTRAKQKLLERLARRDLGAGVLAFGGITGSEAVASAALIERTLALIPSGVTIPSSVHVLTQGVTGMLMFRFKLLAAGVLVATGLGLSVGGGWQSSATAQAPGGGGGPLMPPPGGAPAKGDPKIEELKDQLEAARAALFQAERQADLKARRERAALQDAAKFDYEALPKNGLTTKEFETKFLEREKAGWSFVGQVSIDTSKERGSGLGSIGPGGGGIGFTKEGTTPCLVFRKQAPSMAPGGSGMMGPMGPGAPGGGMRPPVGSNTPNSAPPMGLPGNSAGGSSRPPGFGGSDPEVENALRKKIEAEYQAVIAELKKQIEALKAGKPSAKPGAGGAMAPLAYPLAEIVVTGKPAQNFKIENPDSVAKLAAQFPGILGERGSEPQRRGAGGWKTQITILFHPAEGQEGSTRVAHVSPDFSEWIWRDNTSINFARQVKDANALRDLLRKLADEQKVDQE